ncbi:MAG: PucC family protein, partial [Rhizobiaceae bacterium]|nr:PucC family protein [Rhizobiaceae bacterium]
LGFANGAFAVAAIASMMALAGASGSGRAGLRMGLWGAAQGIAFGLGGFAGTVAVDVIQALGGPAAAAYGSVFLLDGLLFLAAAGIALRVAPARRSRPSGEVYPAALQAAE